MTRERQPVTFANALTDIARLLGWDGCADVLGKSESHVRKLGAPDTEREISLRDALRLDAAYRRAGGQGAPLLECYAIKLDIDLQSGSARPVCLLDGAAKAAKETGEAVAAAIALSNHQDDQRQRKITTREIEEAITSLTRLLTHIADGSAKEKRT